MQDHKELIELFIFEPNCLCLSIKIKTKESFLHGELTFPFFHLFERDRIIILVNGIWEDIVNSSHDRCGHMYHLLPCCWDNKGHEIVHIHFKEVSERSATVVILECFEAFIAMEILFEVVSS
jgi:hypothetical protein